MKMIECGLKEEGGEYYGYFSFGKVRYYLSNDKYKSYTEAGLCDTFEELRDRVFSDDMRENVEEDKYDEENYQV